MTRWEYKFIEIKRKFFTGSMDLELLETQLNGLGREGLELVSVNQNPMGKSVAILKREK